MDWEEANFGDVGDDARHTTGSEQQHRVAGKVALQKSPFGIFLCVFPMVLFEAIAKCSEKKRSKRCNTVSHTRNDFKHHFEPITVSDIVVFFGLLILNMLHGFKEGISSQWRMHGSGVRAVGRFGAWMPRDKFRVIGRYLSFYDHDIPPNTDDRHYRLRFVVETLNKSFRACYKLGKYIAFDEATFACVSKFLPARVFNPMKPHRYGLKVFMTCCGVTGYCFGFEMYQGAGTPNQDDAFDKKSGPQALFRAMK